MKTLSKGAEMPITAAAFPCWMSTERTCRRNCQERSSPYSALILCLSCETDEMASGANIPVVSVAMDREEVVTGAENLRCTSEF